MSDYDVPDNPTDQGFHDEAPALRASDTERDDALHVLAGHYADGRLQRAEFDERADVALAARTRDQLRALFADLPGPVPVPASAAAVDASSSADRVAAAIAAARERRVAMTAGRAPLLLVPVFLMLTAIAVRNGLPPFPVIPLMIILSRRRRRWNREARPWT